MSRLILKKLFIVQKKLYFSFVNFLFFYKSNVLASKICRNRSQKANKLPNSSRADDLCVFLECTRENAGRMPGGISYILVFFDRARNTVQMPGGSVLH